MKDVLSMSDEELVSEVYNARISDRELLSKKKGASEHRQRAMARGQELCNEALRRLQAASKRVEDAEAGERRAFAEALQMLEGVPCWACGRKPKEA